ncbi:MAG TPA: hypothetical protein VKY45_13025 [Marinilabiliaceae bacterium]|nr:hypothetical protein [Marinilabiliaceae bacterium]
MKKYGNPTHSKKGELNTLKLLIKTKTQTYRKDTGVRMRKPQGYASPVLKKNLHPHL